MVLLEVLVILEVQRRERYLVGETARRDPHVVDWTRASALERCCGQAAPDSAYRLVASSSLSDSNVSAARSSRDRIGWVSFAASRCQSCYCSRITDVILPI
jgi:hypothetical protein